MLRRQPLLFCNDAYALLDVVTDGPWLNVFVFLIRDHMRSVLFSP